jgi:hypothetical protein
MATDMISMPDEAYERFLREAGASSDPETPSEENLLNLISSTMRETNPEMKAKGFVDVANMSLAMADKTLGSQVPVAKCLVLDLH